MGKAKRAVYAIPAVGLLWTGCDLADSADPGCRDGINETGEQCDDGNAQTDGTSSGAVAIAAAQDPIIRTFDIVKWRGVSNGTTGDFCHLLFRSSNFHYCSSYFPHVGTGVHTCTISLSGSLTVNTGLITSGTLHYSMVCPDYSGGNRTYTQGLPGTATVLVSRASYRINLQYHSMVLDCSMNSTFQMSCNEAGLQNDETILKPH